MATRPVPTPEEIWRNYDATEARLSAPLSERMMALAGLRPGMRVLDIATGRGEPAVRVARAVAPGGFVLGVDVSASMLGMAKERAAREGVSNLELRVANAETLEGVAVGQFDATFARWGLMYMDAPVAALAAARRAMVPGGVLVAALWVAPEAASFFTLPRRVLERYRAPTDAFVTADAPGTFRYADQARFERDLAKAGLVSTHVEELEVPVMEAATDKDLVAWTRAFGLTRLMEGLSQEVQRSWERDFVAAAAPLRKDGFVRLGGVTRLVVASAAA
jgi:ubiquinone/menaquinone biosynthesis C-methylase UbiE